MMTQDPTRFDAALEDLKQHENSMHASMIPDYSIEALREALLIAKALMGEPDEAIRRAMSNAYHNNPLMRNVFKATAAALFEKVKGEMK